MLVPLAAVQAADVEQWGVWELSLDGPRDGNPYLDVQVTATCRQDEKRIVVPAFYDGDGVYKARVSPPAELSVTTFWTFLRELSTA